MIKLVKSEFSGPKGVVTVQGDNFAEASSLAAKEFVIDEATKRIGICGISGSSGPYPVDLDGNEVLTGEQLSKLAAAQEDPKQPKFSYHNDFNMIRAISA